VHGNSRTINHWGFYCCSSLYFNINWNWVLGKYPAKKQRRRQSVFGRKFIELDEYWFYHVGNQCGALNVDCFSQYWLYNWCGRRQFCLVCFYFYFPTRGGLCASL